jgi:hypothetical protein
LSTSGTTSYTPSLGDFVIAAYARCGVKRTELIAQHMADARFEANMITSEWTASGVNLWAVDSQVITIIGGQSLYTIPSDTVFILDAYLTTLSTSTDTIILPISRSDYAAIPNKTSLGTPTTYWYDRTLSETMTLWQVPSASSTWTLTYWRATRIQDSILSNGTTPEVPYRFYDAFLWALAARLAFIYAPDRAPALAQAAQRAWMIAISSDTENVPIMIMPALRGYYR